MKSLSDILYKVNLVAVYGEVHKTIHTLQFDSRLITQGDVFVAIKGTQTDGHQYIDEVIEKGAIAIICEEVPRIRNEQITYVQVQSASTTLGIMACNFYDNPSHTLKIIGVTGTNGKTTVSTLLYQVLNELGYPTGLISTVNYRIMDKTYPSTHTTPDALSLNKMFTQMIQSGCEYCVMEVSSHALELGRVEGTQFVGGVFTNITHDHLDFHETFDRYRYAKKKLFDKLPLKSFAVYNNDDRNGQFMVQNCKGKKVSYGLERDAQIKAKILENSFQGLWLQIDQLDAWFRLIGKFNAYNLVAVWAVLQQLNLGLDEIHILTALSQMEGAEGRFQSIVSPNHIYGVVDYAHTPDALKNVLETINDLKQEGQKVITVVGCGGNRDTSKRPIMGNIASEYSDVVIFTSDNPRFEDPEQILDHIEAGVTTAFQHKKCIRITDRKKAIEEAVKLAQPHDIILIAGKGHETYQEVQGVKYPFDDRDVLINFLNTQ